MCESIGEKVFFNNLCTLKLYSIEYSKTYEDYIRLLADVDDSARMSFPKYKIICYFLHQYRHRKKKIIFSEIKYCYPYGPSYANRSL